MLKKWFGLMASASLVGVVALVGNGCSSSSSGGATGDDSGTSSDGPIHHPEAATDDSGATDDGGGEAGPPADGTTGKACTSDADCKGAAGINKCSSDGLFTSGQLYATPVCLMPANCDPGSDGNIHFCDGPDAATSPGVCLPTGTAGKGVCLPQCNFKPDGGPVTGCQGKDSCFVYGFNADPTTQAITGIGYCFAGCEADADCQTGQKCQVEEGICVKAPKTDLAAGTGCNSAATPAPACNCIANTSNNLGYCGNYCKTGGKACPSGWICDAQLPLTLTNSADASVAGWTAANPNMGGFCAPGCVVDGGANFDGGVCPPNSSCLNGDLGGPDCLP